METVRLVRCEVESGSDLCIVRYGFMNACNLSRFTNDRMPVLSRYMSTYQRARNSSIVIVGDRYSGIVWDYKDKVYRYDLEEMQDSELSYHTTMKHTIESLTVHGSLSIVVVPKVHCGEAVDVQDFIYVMVCKDWFPLLIYKVSATGVIRFAMTDEQKNLDCTYDVIRYIRRRIKALFNLHVDIREAADRWFSRIGYECEVVRLTYIEWNKMTGG